MQVEVGLVHRPGGGTSMWRTTWGPLQVMEWSWWWMASVESAHPAHGGEHLHHWHSRYGGEGGDPAMVAWTSQHFADVLLGMFLVLGAGEMLWCVC